LLIDSGKKEVKRRNAKSIIEDIKKSKDGDTRVLIERKTGEEGREILQGVYMMYIKI
jgi:hypothetical protein